MQTHDYDNMGISNTKDDSSLMKAKRAFAKQYVRNDT